MSPPVPAVELAQAARRVYADTLVRASAAAPPALIESLQQRLLKPALPRQTRVWQDCLAALQQHGAGFQMGLISKLRLAQRETQEPGAVKAVGGVGSLSLVADDTIEREIDASRLALALDADSLWQFTDLRTRMLSLERRNELAAHDLLRANVVARLWVEAWSAAGLGHAEWLEVQEAIQAEFSQWVGLAYHDTNLWLIQRGVMPEVDLRPFIRRSGGVVGNNSLGTSFLESAHGAADGRGGRSGPGQAAS